MTDIAIIAGTGFESLPELTLETELECETRWGPPSAPLQHGRLDGHSVWFLSRHGHDHGLAPHAINYRANLQALADQGVTRVLAVYTTGGIAAELAPGSFVVPHDLVDYTWGREHSFSTPGNVLHEDMSEPWDPALRAALIAAGRQVLGPDGALFDRGVYAATQGPRLETPAEINRLERDGCTVVGMTGMPETGLARELGMAMAAIALVVNPAAGRGAISMAEIEAVAGQGRTRLLRILAAVVAELS